MNLVVPKCKSNPNINETNKLGITNRNKQSNIDEVYKIFLLDKYLFINKIQFNIYVFDVIEVYCFLLEKYRAPNSDYLY